MRSLTPYFLDFWFALAVLVLPILTRRRSLAFWLCLFSGAGLLVLLWILEYAPLREHPALYLFTILAVSLAAAVLAGWLQRLKERRDGSRC